MSKRKTICIFGESPLAIEYAAICAQNGFEVHLRLNESRKKTSLPKGIKRVSKASKTTQLALELTNISLEAKKKNLIELDESLPAKIPIVSSSVTITIHEQSSWLVHQERLVGIGALPSLLEGRAVELAPPGVSNDTAIATTKEFIVALGKEPVIVQDSMGLVMPRILCMLANEACFAMMEGVAAGKDIDTAMKLGTNYPHGPVEWAERIGAKQVYAVMSALHRHFGEDRYRVAPLLQSAAVSNSFATKGTP